MGIELPGIDLEDGIDEPSMAVVISAEQISRHQTSNPTSKNHFGAHITPNSSASNKKSIPTISSTPIRVLVPTYSSSKRADFARLEQTWQKL